MAVSIISQLRESVRQSLKELIGVAVYRDIYMHGRLFKLLLVYVADYCKCLSCPGLEIISHLSDIEPGTH